MTIVIHNFLDNVEEILDLADSVPYYDYTHHPPARFMGERSQNIVNMCWELRENISKKTGKTPRGIFFHKHKNLIGFHTRPHTDATKYAGVIYLRGEQGCGTIVGNKLYTYEHNKLICYQGDIPHRPEGFPCDRLVITFFC